MRERLFCNSSSLPDLGRRYLRLGGAVTLFLLLLGVAAKSYALSWTDLWATKDQQAQIMMSKGQFSEAQKTFEDPAWRAAAAYRAGHYEQAAKQYQSIQTELGYYNKGNALAHEHQYQQAIQAYDKALAINPNNKEALYNRKLVEELVNKNKDDANKQQDKDQQGKDQQGKDQQGKDQQGKDQQGKDQQDKDQQDKDQQGKDQQGKDQQDKDQQGKDQQGKDQQGKDQQDKDQQGNNQEDKEHGDQQLKKTLKKSRVEPTKSAAEREKQQAKEQWLKLIPDDPGGLMREKFLRDYRRRQEEWVR